jgi:hypothetical protein
MKENNKGTGTLFSPELKEIVKRLNDKEPELDRVLKSDSGQDFFRESKGSRKFRGKVQKQKKEV